MESNIFNELNEKYREFKSNLKEASANLQPLSP